MASPPLSINVFDEFRSQVSDEWLARRPFPEMAFLLGVAHDLADPQNLLAVARGADGSVEGFVTWTPVPEGGGWMLDMMRRRSDAMPGLMDFKSSDPTYEGTARTTTRACAPSSPRWSSADRRRHIR